MEPVLPLPHLKSTALHILVIHLGVAESGALPVESGRAVHAQVLDWFRMADPAISEAIHKSQESPLSLSGLVGKRRKVGVRAGDEFYFRIGLLDGSLIEPLLSGLEKWGDKPFSLAKCPFVFRSINMLPGTDPWVGSSDYALLTQTPATLDNLALKLLSPTSFKSNAGQGIQPFPLPESVFGNLHRRWNVFAPKELQFPKIQWSGLVSDYDLKTQKLRMENSVEIGAVGWVRYRFPDPEQARIATILAHFAFFAGVGRKTAMGMGQVVLDKKT
uniref:CRISPR-associated protein Cas6 n=1 Tax=Cyanothece sp. (strain PCC 7425 / ATCC 29141) TaxID=395961 RepID=B8HXC7_CYAP4